MAKAKMVDKLIVTTPNDAGTLAKITGELVASGVNMLHLCAYAEGGKGNFILVTSDNRKAAELMKHMGYEVSEGQTLEIEFENKPGTLSPVAKSLGDNGVDIQYIFGTSADGEKIVGLISTNDDEKALQIINS